MPAAALIGAGLGLAGNIYQGIQGSRLGKQQMQYGRDMQAEAERLAAMERPEFQVPEAVRRSVQLAQGRQYQRMPGIGFAENQLGQSTAAGAGAIGEMSSGAEGIGALANLYANQMGQQSNLAMQEAQYRDQAQQGYMGALEGLGDWQQQAWQWNEADPYMQAQQKAAQLSTMGAQNEWEGMKTKMGAWGETVQGLTGVGQQYAEQFGASQGGFGNSQARQTNLNPMTPINPFQ